MKAAAADALAVLTFVGSEHPSDTLEVVQRLQILWKGAHLSGTMDAPCDVLCIYKTPRNPAGRTH